MDPFYKGMRLIGTTMLVGITLGGAIIYGLARETAENTFRQGLQFKVEKIADTNNDGKLDLGEMASVIQIIGQDPATKLKQGFYLSITESQKYLRAKDEFNSIVDSKPIIGKEHPYFSKAKVDGKLVYYPQY